MDRVTRNRVVVHVSGQRKIYRRDLDYQDPENGEVADETIENEVSNLSIDGKQYFVFFFVLTKHIEHKIAMSRNNYNLLSSLTLMKHI